MRLNRIFPLAIVVASLLSGEAIAAALKIATIAPEGSQWMLDLKAGGKEVAARTEGRVTFKFYGGGVMGNDKKVLRKFALASCRAAYLRRQAWRSVTGILLCMACRWCFVRRPKLTTCANVWTRSCSQGWKRPVLSRLVLLAAVLRC